MVYRGPSRGCLICRKRRVKCDQARPSCSNCVRRKEVCTGYRTDFGSLHIDETKTIPERIRRKESDYVSPDEDEEVDEGFSYEIIRSPSKSNELDSLYFFFRNYASLPRDPSTNIFLTNILPLYSMTSANSAFSLATAAIATNLRDRWHNRAVDSLDSLESRRVYAKALARLKIAILDPVESTSDGTLASIFLLDIFEAINRRFGNRVENGTHIEGAAAIAKQRGKSSFQTHESRRLLSGVRNMYINYKLNTGQGVDQEMVDMMIPDEVYTPGVQLDTLLAEYLTLRARAKNVLMAGSPQSWISDLSTSSSDYETISSLESILEEALFLDIKLHNWRASLTPNWLPYPITDAHLIDPSIHAAGMYNNTCDVYSSLNIAHGLNSYARTHIFVLRLLQQLQHTIAHSTSMASLASSPAPYSTSTTTTHISDSHIASQIQTHVDSICASVPFFLGNRVTKFLNPDVLDTQAYPPIPPSLLAQNIYVNGNGDQVDMSMTDHARAATAMGGWLLLQPLTGIVSFTIPPEKFAAPMPLDGINPFMYEPLPPFELREGQLDWILGQLRRLKMLYNIPQT